MPNLKAKTSKSGNIAEPIAKNKSNLLDLESITFEAVYATNPCPKIDAIILINYSLFLESTKIVTGPLLTKDTCISAPN